MDGLVIPAGCPLNSRQLAIVRWLADGKTAKDIADIEKLTVNTVHSYIQVSCHDTGAVKSISLVAMALRKGWIA